MTTEGKGNDFQASFDISSDAVEVQVPSAAFGHGNYDKVSKSDWRYRKCFILVRTAPIPSPLFVQYDPGTIGDTNLTTTDNAFNGTNWLTEIGVNKGRMNETGHIYHDERVDEIYKEGVNENDPWLTGSLKYTTAGISDKAKAAALEAGYTFAGWQLEYFNEAHGTTESGTSGYYTAEYALLGHYDRCDRNHDHVKNKCVQATYNGTTYWFKEHSGWGWGDYDLAWNNGSTGTTTGKIENVIKPPQRFNNITLVDPYGSTFGDVGEFGQIDLIINAKLTAIWVPNPQLEATKTVVNMPLLGQFTPTTYNFRIERTDGEPITGYTVIETYEKDGNVRYKETPVTGNTFKLDVTGNRSSTIRIKGLVENTEYRIVEVVPEDAAYKPTYTVNGETGNTFTAKSTKETHVALTVTNDYAAPKGFDITIEKVAPKTNATVADTATPGHATAASETGDWMALTDTTFTITNVNDATKTFTVSPVSTNNGPAIATETLEAGDYCLEETNAPMTYVKAGTINFTVASDGTVTLKEETDSHSVALDGSTLIVANYPAKVEVQLLKVDMHDEGKKLAGAEFALYQGSVAPENLVYTGTTGSNGHIGVDNNGTWEDTNWEIDATKTYILVETKAPDGYMAMFDKKTFTFVEKDDVLELKVAGSETDPVTAVKQDDVYVVTITNNSGTVLPSTGGPGTSLYTVLGAVLMLTAAVLVLEFKRKGRARA